MEKKGLEDQMLKIEKKNVDVTLRWHSMPLL